MSKSLSLEEKLLAAAIAYFLLLKLVFAFGASPLTDEAYYWMWGRHPQLSYYDHPPLGAWVAWLFHAVLGTNLVALRLPTFLAMSGVLAILAAVARRTMGDEWRRVFLRSTLLFVGSPLFGFFGTVAMLDYLLVALSMGAGFFFIRYFDAVEQGSRGALRDLFLAAVLLGLAGLTKYTAAFLALAVVATILVRPKLRPLLLRPELYLAGLVTIAILTPVIWWNAEHGFASFAYQTSERYVGAQFGGFNVGAMKTFVVETAALVSPIILVPATLLFFWARQATAFERIGKTLAIWLFWPAGLTFLYIVNFATVLWWWTAICFVLVLPFGGRYVGPAALGLHTLWGGVVNTFLAVSLAIVPLGGYVGGLMTMETDYAYGWSDLGRAVLAAKAEHKADLIVANRFQSASQLAFALDDADVTALAPSRDAFDDWFDLEAHAGQSAIVLVVPRDDTEYWKQFFAHETLLTEIPISRFGQWLATYQIWFAEDLTPP
jgi:4-amino-4-deoxy-L-arabinose transferase-like glycosyltransferase